MLAARRRKLSLLAWAWRGKVRMGRLDLMLRKVHQMAVCGWLALEGASNRHLRTAQSLSKEIRGFQGAGRFGGRDSRLLPERG